MILAIGSLTLDTTHRRLAHGLHPYHTGHLVLLYTWLGILGLRSRGDDFRSVVHPLAFSPHLHLDWESSGLRVPCLVSPSPEVSLVEISHLGYVGGGLRHDQEGQTLCL